MFTALKISKRREFYRKLLTAVLGKVKLSMYQAVEAHRDVRRQGCHIF
jgi:hypothetical protein